MPPIANHNRLLEQKDSFGVLKPLPEYENYPSDSPEYAYYHSGQYLDPKPLIFNPLFKAIEDSLNSGTIDLRAYIGPNSRANYYGVHIDSNSLANYYNQLENFNTFLYWALKSYMKDHNENTNLFFKDVDFFLSKNNPMKITQVFMQRPGFGEVAVQRALSFYRAPDFYDYIYKLVYNYIEKTRYLSTLNSRELVSHINAIKFESFFGSSFFNELKSSISQVTSINNKIEKIDKQCKIIRMQNELYNADTFLSKQQYIECNYNNSGVVSLFPSGNIFSCYLPIYKRHLWEPFISPDAAIHLVLKIERANLSERCVRATEEVRKSSSIKRMLSEIIRYWRTERGDFRNLAKLDIKFFNRK